jgi:hypothetical protein
MAKAPDVESPFSTFHIFHHSIHRDSTFHYDRDIYIYVERHRAAVARGLLLGLMKAFCMNPNLHM